MCSVVDLDIASALALGDKLQSILLYHFVSGVHPVAKLAGEQQLDTVLGLQLSTPYTLQFGSAAGKVILSLCSPHTIHFFDDPD
jgi:hypothetical protein